MIILFYVVFVVPGGSNGNLSPRPAPQGGAAATQPHQEKTSLVEACTDGDVGTVKKLLTEGRSVHETSEEGESLLSLACSAGYFELAQVCVKQTLSDFEMCTFKSLLVSFQLLH